MAYLVDDRLVVRFRTDLDAADAAASVKREARILAVPSPRDFTPSRDHRPESTLESRPFLYFTPTKTPRSSVEAAGYWASDVVKQPQGRSPPRRP